MEEEKRIREKQEAENKSTFDSAQEKAAQAEREEKAAQAAQAEREVPIEGNSLLSTAVTGISNLFVEQPQEREQQEREQQKQQLI